MTDLFFKGSLVKENKKTRMAANRKIRIDQVSYLQKRSAQIVTKSC